LKKIFSLFVISCLFSCANKQEDIVYEKKFDYGVTFEVASSYCIKYIENYDNANKSDTLIVSTILGQEHPMFKYCMKRYGYEQVKSVK